MWNEKRALKHGVATFACLLIFAIALFVAFEIYSFDLSENIYVDLVIVSLVLYCGFNGIYLWLKGFSRFRDVLKSPLMLAVYAGFTIFSGFYMYFKYGCEDFEKSS